MMNDKTLGYILLIVGIVVIVIATVNVLMVFTGNTQPVQPFKVSGVSLDLGSLIEASLPPELAGSSGQSVPEIKQEIVSADLLNTSLNYFAHLILMGFIASAGFKLGRLGVMLIRPIKVNLKEAKETPKSV